MEKRFKFIIGIIGIVCYICTSIYLVININNFGIIPNKYLIVIYIVMILLLLLIIFLLKRKHIIFYILGIILIGCLSAGYIISSKYINTTNSAIEKISNEKNTSVSYYVLVKNNSSIDSLSGLNDKTIGYIKDVNTKKLITMLGRKVSCTCKEYIGLSSIVTDFINDTPIILNSAYIDALTDEITSFKDTYKVIYTFTIDEKTEDVATYIDITSEPFLIYLSGIDTYGEISTRSRSDVNILIAVNPKTGKILLVNTPRDYYVQLHNTTGLKDKLTHSGIYGIDMSINTMEDLYNVKINKYFRVNFNTLIKVVDQIGGVDINSDMSFTTYTNGKVVVKEGLNHFNGEQALAYSRERYAYASGDRHRGQNQEQVITAIIDKITSTKSLISNYDKILDTLASSFETSFTDSEIKELAKTQLDKNIKWNIESISVDGTGSMSYTYSMGTNYLLYVMVPNQDTLDIAKSKINKIIKEN